MEKYQHKNENYKYFRDMSTIGIFEMKVFRKWA